MEINGNKKEIKCKIVYWGPALSGKIENLRYIFDKLDPKCKGQLISIDTKGEQTLFFDFLLHEISLPRGLMVRFHLHAPPGQFFYRASGRLALRGADGIVYVADSSARRMESNLQSLYEMVQILRDHNNPIEHLPLVMQYNKRNAPDALPIKELEAQLNKWHAPYVEAIAERGTGVFQTLDLITRMILMDMSTKAAFSSRGQPKATFKVAADMTIVSVEGDTAEMCGQGPDELAGQDFLLFFPEEFRSSVARAMESLKGMSRITAEGARTLSGEVDLTIEHEDSSEHGKIFKITLKRGENEG